VQASGGVTAFSKQRERLRGADAGEVAELEMAMEEAVEVPLPRGAREGTPHGSGGGHEALEDDFIVSATQARLI